jgi:hypothetical protein
MILSFAVLFNVVTVKADSENIKLDSKDLKVVEGIKNIEKGQKRSFDLYLNGEKAILTVIKQEDGRDIYTISGNVKDKKGIVNKFKQLKAEALSENTNTTVSVQAANCEPSSGDYGMWMDSDSDSDEMTTLENKTEWCRTKSGGFFGKERVEMQAGGYLELHYWGGDPIDADKLVIKEIITIDGQDIDWNYSWYPGYTIDDSTNTITNEIEVENTWYLETNHINLPFEGDNILTTSESYIGSVYVGGHVWRTSVNGQLDW